MKGKNEIMKQTEHWRESNTAEQQIRIQTET